MARRFFEVISLKFIFNSYQTTVSSKKDFVEKTLSEYLKNCNATLEDGDIIVNAELFSGISFETLIKLLSNMYAETNYKLGIDYSEITKRVTISVIA